MEMEVANPNASPRPGPMAKREAVIEEVNSRPREESSEQRERKLPNQQAAAEKPEIPIYKTTCDQCVRSKIRCDGRRPVCSQCTARKTRTMASCQYSVRRRPGRKAVASAVSQVSLPRQAQEYLFSPEREKTLPSPVASQNKGETLSLSKSTLPPLLVADLTVEPRSIDCYLEVYQEVLPELDNKDLWRGLKVFNRGHWAQGKVLHPDCVRLDLPRSDARALGALLAAIAAARGLMDAGGGSGSCSMKASSGASRTTNTKSDRGAAALCHPTGRPLAEVAARAHWLARPPPHAPHEEQAAHARGHLRLALAATALGWPKEARHRLNLARAVAQGLQAKARSEVPTPAASSIAARLWSLIAAVGHLTTGEAGGPGGRTCPDLDRSVKEKEAGDAVPDLKEAKDCESGVVCGAEENQAALAGFPPAARLYFRWAASLSPFLGPPPAVPAAGDTNEGPAAEAERAAVARTRRCYALALRRYLPPAADSRAAGTAPPAAAAPRAGPLAQLLLGHLAALWELCPQLSGDEGARAAAAGAGGGAAALARRRRATRGLRRLRDLGAVAARRPLLAQAFPRRLAPVLRAAAAAARALEDPRTYARVRRLWAEVLGPALAAAGGPAPAAAPPGGGRSSGAPPPSGGEGAERGSGGDAALPTYRRAGAPGGLRDVLFLPPLEGAAGGSDGGEGQGGELTADAAAEVVLAAALACRSDGAPAGETVEEGGAPPSPSPVADAGGLKRGEMAAGPGDASQQQGRVRSKRMRSSAQEHNGDSEKAWKDKEGALSNAHTPEAVSTDVASEKESELISPTCVADLPLENNEESGSAAASPDQAAAQAAAAAAAPPPFAQFLAQQQQLVALQALALGGAVAVPPWGLLPPPAAFAAASAAMAARGMAAMAAAPWLAAAGWPTAAAAAAGAAHPMGLGFGSAAELLRSLPRGLLGEGEPPGACAAAAARPPAAKPPKGEAGLEPHIAPQDWAALLLPDPQPSAEPAAGGREAPRGAGKAAAAGDSPALPDVRDVLLFARPPALGSRATSLDLARQLLPPPPADGDAAEGLRLLDGDDLGAGRPLGFAPDDHHPEEDRLLGFPMKLVAEGGPEAPEPMMREPLLPDLKQERGEALPALANSPAAWGARRNQPGISELPSLLNQTHVLSLPKTEMSDSVMEAQHEVTANANATGGEGIMHETSQPTEAEKVEATLLEGWGGPLSDDGVSFVLVGSGMDCEPSLY